MPRPPTPTASASNLGLIRKTARSMVTCCNTQQFDQTQWNVFGAEALLCFQQKHFETFWMLPSPTDHAEFARCPQPLPMGSPSLPVSSCELNKNTRRCHQQPLATHLSCRLYQTCDHAVLISGTTVSVHICFHKSPPNHRNIWWKGITSGHNDGHMTKVFLHPQFWNM